MALGLGLLLRFAVPVPVGITIQGWTLLSIFVSAIVGEPDALTPPILTPHSPLLFSSDGVNECGAA